MSGLQSIYSNATKFYPKDWKNLRLNSRFLTSKVIEKERDHNKKVEKKLIWLINERTDCHLNIRDDRLFSFSPQRQLYKSSFLPINTDQDPTTSSWEKAQLCQSVKMVNTIQNVQKLIEKRCREKVRRARLIKIQNRLVKKLPKISQGLKQ
ncbi:unnamed protein product [Moneuplotes crassus]|uniref:Uncharacterized protein n=1 Tax=Euplotes crassus TaxID=5936 RepID=A0AAD1X5R6_EUPCR|nr:unnamed protein product [Moneuplotes crassus]